MNLTWDLGRKLERFATDCTTEESAAGTLRSFDGP